jgi:hypothetical protein
MRFLNYSSIETAANPAHRILPRGWLSLLAFPLASLLGGCAGNPHQATTGEYYRDARLCHAQNLIKPKVRTNIGGNLSEDIVAGVDTANYLKCMDRLGWQQDAKTDPLLKALEKCREKTGRQVTAAKEPGGARLNPAPGRNAFQECLGQRGFEGEVTVEPLQGTEPK